ncbi:MAG: hypothetical protein AAF292_14245 [Pseudomonadota bacterium]
MSATLISLLDTVLWKAMNTISGKILRNDDKSGVSDVIVILYDLDIALRNPKENDDTGVTVPGFDPKFELSSQRYLELIYGSPEREEDSILGSTSAAADRLGSVITNKVGGFALEYDDEAFRVGDNESRPDLVLIVIAPDRTAEGDKDKSTPLGIPEIRRVLHLSSWPNRNIGRQEEMIIYINDAVLAQHGIAQTTKPKTPEEFASSITASTERQKEIRNAISKVVDIKGNVENKRNQIAKAKAFTANLSAVNKKQRADKYFVADQSKSSAIEARARRSGLENIKANTEIQNVTQPFARIQLNNADLLRFGIEGPGISNGLDGLKEALRGGREIPLFVNIDQFCATLQQKSGGVVLEAIDRSVAENVENEKPTEERDEADTQPSQPDSNAEDIIKKLVLEQVASLGASIEEAPEKTQSERILEKIQTLKPPASPADVTAFHDFTHLQIAFPDVWEEAFDRNLKSLFEELHINYEDEARELPGGEVFGVDGINLDELDDLKDYSELMQSFGADLLSAGSSGTPPPAVREFVSHRGFFGEELPEIDAPDPDVAELERARIEEAMETNGLRFIYPELRDDLVRILDDNWPKLSIDQQEELLALASAEDPDEDSDRDDSEVTSNSERIEQLFGLFTDTNMSGNGLSTVANLIQNLSADVEPPPKMNSFKERLARAQQIITNPQGRISRVQNLLAEMAQRISQPHSFQVFAKNSVNFGILSTYRQKWVPGDYQVGDLVSTLPLAPGENRKYNKKETIKKTRSQKENEKFASTIKDERQITSRAVSDIVDKAQTTTNFQSTVQTSSEAGLFGIAGFSANTTTQFQRNQATESQRVKKSFREAVRKASQEYKNERAIELSTEDVSEFEASFSSEISNPNNEITVTYLFYELERQYRVTEHLQRLNPVILVAQEVPNPADIDEDWLLAHEWILRRSLLDASFEDALDYISDGLVADEVMLETRREAYETQKALVEELAENVETLASAQATLRDALVQTSQREKLARVARKRARKRRRRRLLRKIFMPLPIPGAGAKIASGASGLGFGSRGEDPEALEAQREALETRLGFIEGNLEDGRARLTRANTALENATEELTEAVEDSFTKRNLVAQLRIHVKDNILHYMQMIWSYEPTDQRFFRLYGIKVPEFEPEDLDDSEDDRSRALVKFRELDDIEKLGFIIAARFGNFKPGDSILGVQIPPAREKRVSEKRLHEIADLDHPLGFKGNYMIFPLKECTYLTDYMMQDYVDNYFGIRDPDPATHLSTEELLEYADNALNDDSISETEKEAIKGVVQARLTSPRLEDELVVVPTGQLFIEALKGEHALLEDFKRKHRALDVLKVNEEVREMQLENLRRAARLVGDSPNLDDPDVDKNIHINSPQDISVDTD